jgi:hypothetical protein
VADEPRGSRRDPGRSGDYRVVRSVVAFLLMGCIMGMVAPVIWRDPTYRIDPVALGILVGGILGVVGIPVAERIFRQ